MEVIKGLKGAKNAAIGYLSLFTINPSSTNVLLRYVENASTQTLHEKRWQTLAGRPFELHRQVSPSFGPGKSSSVRPVSQ